MDEWIQESETGGRKGQKLERFDLLDPDVMQAVARQFGRGAFKYGDRNYQKGYDWSLSYAAAQRHLNAFWGGENWDPDPFWDEYNLGRPHHLDAAIFHLMALREFFNKHPEFDDRATKPGRNTTAAGADSRTDWQAAVSEQAKKRAGDPEQEGQTSRPLPGEWEPDRRVSDVQASRWDVP